MKKKASVVNKATIANLIISCWVLIRVEQINLHLNHLVASLNGKFDQLVDVMNRIGLMLVINIQGAQDQFAAAIDSILSLFGGSGA